MNDTELTIPVNEEPTVMIELPLSQMQLLKDLMKVVIANSDRISPEHAKAADLILDRIEVNME